VGHRGFGFANRLVVPSAPKPLYIASFREPISRLISQFDFIMATDSVNFEGIHAAWKDLSFDEVIQRYDQALRSGIKPYGQAFDVELEFVYFYRMMHQQTSFMCGFDCVFMPYFDGTNSKYSKTRAARFSEEEMLVQALKNLNQTECVAVLDNLDSLIPQMKVHLPWYSPRYKKFPLDNKHSGKKSTVNESNMKLLRKWMDVEIRFYEAAKEVSMLRIDSVLRTK
jgi:hypothetical protein